MTKLRWLAEHEPDERRPRGRGLPPARLADLAAGRARRTSTTLVTDRGDATRHRLLVARRPATTGRDLLDARARPRRRAAPRARPADAGRATADGLPGRGARRRARATTWPPRSGSAPARATSSSPIGTSGVVVRGRRRAGGRRHRHRGRLRRRDRPLPAAGLHAQRRPGARRDGRGCSASTSTTCRRPRARGARRAPAGWCSCPTSRASAPPTGPTPPARCTACSCDRDPRAPGPRRGRGAAVRARRRARRAGAARRRGSSGSSSSAAARAPRRCGASPRPSSAARSLVPAARRVRRRRRGPAGGVGAGRAATSRRRGRWRPAERTRPTRPRSSASPIRGGAGSDRPSPDQLGG